MVRPAAKELGVLGMVKEALCVPVRNGALTVSVLLVLLPCNLLIAVPNLLPRVSVDVTPLTNRLSFWRQHPIDGGEPPFVVTVAPVKFAIEQLTTVAIVYLSAVACEGKHATAGELVAKVRRSWKKVTVSLLYDQLLSFTFIVFFLMLSKLITMLTTPTSVVLLVILSLFSTFCFAVLVSLYVDMACKLGLVISAVEEDKSGVSALAKAVSLTRGRRLRGLVLIALCVAMQLALWLVAVQDPAETEIVSSVELLVGRVVGVLIGLGLILFVWLLWTVFYHECKKRHGKDGRVDEAKSLIPISSNVHGNLA